MRTSYPGEWGEAHLAVSTTARAIHGPVCLGPVGPNSATSGIRRAEHMWMGRLSALTTTLHWSSIAQYVIIGAS